MNSLDQMIANLDVRFGNRYSLDTIINVKSQARRFLLHVGVKEGYTRSELLGYVDHLIEMKYRPRSISVIIGEVKQLFLANNLPWPLQQGDLHLGIPRGEILSPILAPREIAKLIVGTRNLGLPDGPIVALSTIWGLRSTELTLVLNAGMNGKELVVQSAKGGEVRHHIIPAPLQQLLTFPPYRISRDAVQRLFNRLMKAHVRLRQNHEGWHAIRRAVVTGLRRNKVDRDIIYFFMGWRQTDMTFVYWHPEQVEEIDLPVYELHPFLRFYVK